ncbi:hypothetical protein [Tropicibacter oceani]|uniref:DUF1772 domain-containing protein n=1 Tax=Tropicibacter oceani TaxID=3058420 RepID=A0ABY8QHY0_9RHOB|nr:hypothetical protein [Tropicibacter oceani]WGW03767.1 hypothetical protein QF118_17905 [Tropicibacter oceani]
MGRLLLPMSMLSLLSIGAIFGFFYAWACSTMWGLDAIDPEDVAVPADSEAARTVWQAYSPQWQFWNTLGMNASGAALILTGLAVHFLNSERA